MMDVTINMKVEIRRNSDGVVAMAIWKNWDHYNEYWWEEGNASCDCNRKLFFHQAEGTDAGEIPCGNGAYSVRLSNADTGEILHDEF